ncbi:uncharacterized protein ACMZJ9_016075 [Mantella aurantiaca]
MEKEWSHMTERILDLTLEIIYLLNGENYIAFKISDGLAASNLKKTPSSLLEPLSHCLRKNKKILEVTQKMIGVLTGEVMLDVNQTDCGAHPTEEAEEPYVMGDGPSKEGEIPPEISTDPGDTRDPQRDIKAEEEEAIQVRIKEEEILPEISTDCRMEDKGEAYSSLEGNPITLNLYPVGVVLSSDPSTRDGSLPNLSPTVPYPAARSECEPFPRSGDSFIQREDLTSHQRGPEGEKPYSCSECGKRFPRKQELIGHQRTHTAMKSFSCTECGRCFTRRSSLTEHERIHTGMKPYSCSECGKNFSQKSTFYAHKKVHTGEKPFSCSECGRCFSQKYHLTLHQRSHTGEKPYSCLECGRGFAQKSLLIGHVRIHTGEKPHSCAECGKKFTLRSNLVAHKKVHARVKPYSCSECDNCFPSRDQLTIHQASHLGKKRYSCSECGRCFSELDHLLLHLRTHTGQKTETGS